MNYINKGVPCQHVKDEEKLKRNLDRNRPVAVLTKIEPSSRMYRKGIRWTQSIEIRGKLRFVSYMVIMLEMKKIKMTIAGTWSHHYEQKE